MTIRSRKRLLTDLKGSALVEFAAVSPVIIMVIFGAMQVSMLLYANATMRRALGEGARMATLYRTPPSATAWAGPTAAEICDKTEGAIKSFGNAEITGLTLTRVSNGTAPSIAHGLQLVVNYNVDIDWIFFTTSPTLTSTRRVYLRTQPDFGATAFNCLA